VGSPAEVFDRPRTRFVAEFVGKANILTGRLDGGNRLALAEGLQIQVSRDADAPSHGEAAVCLRPHNVVLTHEEAEARGLKDRGFNLFPGVVRRHIYFGDAIDYSLELSFQRMLRGIAPPSQRYDNGQRVYAAAHPDHCVLVKEA
jgi:ABC-type Fe3+/spermidine/putrescine transport system ATPase subunit